jgi:2-methylcitrate dehydratase PrpD
MSLHPADGATAKVARFVADARFEDIPAHALKFATDAITDAVGVGLYGSRQPIAQALLRVIGTSRSDADHLLLGTSLRAAAVEAALYNGTAIHAIDYDDTAHPSYSHPSAHLVPVLLTLGRQFQRSGRDLLLAYALGLELEGKLGLVLNMGHYLKGWHTTGTFGAVSSAAAAARLAGLDAQRTAVALGIAASAASGVRANFGTMTKPLHAGYAARSGALAALLAAEGFTAVENVLEARYGYLDTFRADEAPAVEALDALGHPWELDSPYGIALKPFPACGSTHTAIEAALELRPQLQGERIRAIRVGTNELCSQTLIYHDPRTPLEGKFSMEFCVAAALVRGEVVIDTFVPEAMSDPQIRALIPRFTVEVDERVRHNGEHGTVVRITTESGRELEQLVPLARGKPERWMAPEVLWNKFHDCARVVLEEPRARRAFDALQGLAQAPSIDAVLAALRVEDGR